MSMIVLSVADLCVDIGGKRILDGISFSVSQGENITVLGPNGAGKTTLLRAIAGFNEFSGSVFCGEESVPGMASHVRASRIGFVAQHPEMDNDFTVRTFLELSRYPYKRPWERLGVKDVDIIKESLEMTGCCDFFDRRISTLSGGERQRVFIAAAIAQDTDIILFDEPLTHLDPVQRTRISRLISNISGAGRKSIVTVTHEINEAIQDSSRIIVLDGGVKEFDGLSTDAGFKGVLDAVFKTSFIAFDNVSRGKPFLFPGEEQ